MSDQNLVYIPTSSDWQFMLQWGQQAIKSGMLPPAIRTPEAAAIIVLKGRELGLSFMTSIAHIHVINGKPCMSAELIQGMARRNVPGLVINILESSARVARIEFIRPEKGAKPFIQEFTIEDAQSARLNARDVWRAYPAAMLWSRCITAGLRKVCPEALMGISYTPEELGADVDSEGHVIEESLKPSDVEIIKESLEFKPRLSPEMPKPAVLEPVYETPEPSLARLIEVLKAANMYTRKFTKPFEEKYNVTSLRELNKEQLGELIAHVEEIASLPSETSYEPKPRLTNS